MRELRRIAVSVLLAAAAAGIGAVAPPGGQPPLGSPSGIFRWWASAGPIYGGYGVARLLVIALLSLWAVLLALRSAVAGTRFGGVVALRLVERVAAGGRRAGVAGLLRVVLGLSATGVGAAGCSISSGTATLGGPAHPVPSNTAATGLGPPVLIGPRMPVAEPRPSAVVPATVAPAGSTPTGGGADPQPTPVQGGSPMKSPPARPELPPVPAAVHRESMPPGPAAPAPAAANETGPDLQTWTVRPGDDLWSIAANVASARGYGAEHIGAYWQTLIVANRARLPVPTDPSLIVAGDVLLLPPLAT